MNISPGSLPYKLFISLGAVIFLEVVTFLRDARSRDNYDPPKKYLPDDMRESNIPSKREKLKDKINTYFIIHAAIVLWILRD
jgi:hypothetical protein